MMRSMPRLEAELTGRVVTIPAPNSYIYSSYANEDISNFIEGCDLYHAGNKIWPDVREAEQKTKEKYLYAPLMAIINEILQTFVAPGQESRQVVDTHNVRMSRIEGEEEEEEIYEQKDDGDTHKVKLKSSPDLSILGQGSHISGSHTLPPQSDYYHCLCPVEIKPAHFNAHAALIQAALYARQCFIHQPHRRYVPVVVISGSFLHLHIHDRAGVLCKQEINIHSDPPTFVRIILGVSTVGNDLHSSPFDPRVRWKPKAQHPTITFHDNAFGHTLEYQITGTRYSRRSLCGRGTYCFDAQTENGEGKVVAVVIKDTWRSSDRAAEWELMEKIKGLDGVGQILGYQDDDCTITTFREHIMGDVKKYTHDRRFSRLVLQAYEPSIRHFTSKLGLLEAFYDAVNGHKNLWKAGILHRDVGVGNILYGLPGAGVKNRGVLIDLDMAIDVTSTRKIGQSRTGTRAFQSVAVLKSLEWGPLAPPQDHLDDLESFSLVLASICIKYDDTGVSRSPNSLYLWEHPNAEICASCKRGFLEMPVEGQLTKYFSTPVFHRLLSSLFEFCDAHYRRKVSAVREAAKKEEPVPSLVDIHRNSTTGKDHDTFLAFIEAAINAQKSEESRTLAVEPTSIDTPAPGAIKSLDPATGMSQD